MYFKLTNGSPDKYSLRQLRSDNPNTSFPAEPTDALLAEWDVYPYTRPSVPEYDNLAWRLIDDVFTQDAQGNWSLPYKLEALPLEDAQRNVRSHRDSLLSECDWVVIMHTEKGTNIPMDWEVYRQALRDITAQEGFPFNVTWPSQP